MAGKRKQFQPKEKSLAESLREVAESALKEKKEKMRTATAEYVMKNVSQIIAWAKTRAGNGQFDGVHLYDNQYIGYEDNDLTVARIVSLLQDEGFNVTLDEVAGASGITKQTRIIVKWSA